MYISLKQVDNFSSTSNKDKIPPTMPILAIKHLANKIPHDLNTNPVIYINGDQTQLLQLALINSIHAKQQYPYPMPVGFIPNTGYNGINSNDGLYDATKWGHDSSNATLDPEDFNTLLHEVKDVKREC
jgi:hypothetical protein